MIVWGIVALGVVVAAGYGFLSLYPPLGGKKRTFPESSHYRGGAFHYPLPTRVGMSAKDMLGTMREFSRKDPARQPSGRLDVRRLRLEALTESDEPAVVWFGHSTYLLQLAGKRILVDPMLGSVASPFPWFGTKRYGGRPPIEPEELPELDVVLVTHDHYDHLDYGTVRKLKGKVRRYIVPLGVGSHLVRWGIPSESITELDWWTECEADGLRLVCTPARHFSGRGPANRNTTLMGSWVVAGGGYKVYVGGDSGYGPHYAEIGERYGPFDLTVLECGQYDRRWAAIHMLPEETVQAHLDLRGDVLLPVHWGAFTLALHPWTEPIERALRAAGERGVRVATPRIGEVMQLRAAGTGGGAGGNTGYPAEAWWRAQG